MFMLVNLTLCTVFESYIHVKLYNVIYVCLATMLNWDYLYHTTNIIQLNTEADLQPRMQTMNFVGKPVTQNL